MVISSLLWLGYLLWLFLVSSRRVLLFTLLCWPPASCLHRSYTCKCLWTSSITLFFLYCSIISFCVKCSLCSIIITGRRPRISSASSPLILLFASMLVLFVKLASCFVVVPDFILVVPADPSRPVLLCHALSSSARYNVKRAPRRNTDTMMGPLNAAS